MADNDTRETPHAFFADLDAKYHFDLDACATHSNAKCPLYFTVDGHWAAPVANGIRVPGEAMFLGGADGLSGSWEGRNVWANVPYSDIATWIRKAWASRAAKVVMLLPADRFDQAFWHELVEPYREQAADYGHRLPHGWDNFTTQFVKGRLRFLKDGKTLGSPRFGSVLLIWQR